MTDKPKAHGHQDKPEPDKGGKDQYKRHVDGSITVTGQIETHFPPSYAEKRETDRKDDASDRNRKFWANFVIGLLTLIAVIVYATITYWQARLSRELIDNTSKQFQKDIRPYVWETGVTPPEDIHLAPHEIVTFQIGWINYGKSPAVNVSQTGAVILGIRGVDAMEIVDMQVDIWDGKEVNLAAKLRAHGGSEAMITSADALEKAVRAKGPPPVEHRANIIPPGIPTDIKHPFGGRTVVKSFEPPQDFDYAVNTDNAVVAITRTEYYDLYGTRYWSDMCLSRHADGSIAKCPRHNEMH